MEKNRGVSIMLLLISALALLFQLIGLFSPAWMKFDLKVNSNDTHMSEQVSMGLWMVSACVDLGYPSETQCATISIDQLSKLIGQSDQAETGKVAGQQVLGSFVPMQALTIIGGLAAICGVVFTTMYVRSDPEDPSGTSKSRGIICAIFWIISAILVFAAVGCQANQNTTFANGVKLLSTIPDVKEQLQMEVKFPWAILMSGIGAFFSVLVGLIVSLRLCTANNTGVPGTWNTFTNQAI